MKMMIYFAAIIPAASPALARTYVYLSVAGESRIAVFEMNTQTGELSRGADADVGGSPGSLAVDPERRFLFASLRSTNSLASFRIDTKTGGLTPINEITAGANAAYVATDGTGRFLLSAYYGAGKAQVHPIREDGSLDSRPAASVATAANAHAIVTDRSNRFAFVPHTGPNAIFQFHFDGQTGRLAPNSVAKVVMPENTGPRHIWFHPSGNSAYTSNEQGSSVTAYRFDAGKGQLAPLQTLSTLPADFTGSNTCADIEADPSGRFVYVSNRGHDSIACFAVDAATGTLTSLGQAPTEQTPRSFNVDPAGRFLYAAGQSSGKLAAYRIDTQTGKLARFQTYDVGKQPSWVLVVSVNQ